MFYLVIVFLVFSVNTEAVKVILRLPPNAGYNNSTRIIGGRQIGIAEAPWQVALFDNQEFVCGGSVITSRHILTAAHCVKGYPKSGFKIRAGSTFRESGGQVRRISKIEYDKSYNDRTNKNDIAIMKLSKPLKLNELVKPVIIPSNYKPIPEYASVTGWGLVRESAGNSSPNLREVSVQFISLSKCQKNYNRENVKIYPSMLCAGATNGGKDACQGDSGGPLVANGIQYGIVSFGIGCGRPNFPGVYTSVAAKKEWISRIVETI